MTATKELLPRVETFPIGEVVGVPAALDDVIGVLQLRTLADTGRLAMAGPLFGMVLNDGTSPFVFSVEESEDDGASDAYAGIDIRVAEAAVSSVTVAPGGRVVFSIEPSEITTANVYLRFKATAAEKYGEMAIAAWHGDLQRWESRATA
ncbi:hypothetical protein LCGC14_2249850 [marine sediment metagenome]|uniref:Uncharacterized protein n=1 Tax=marine sediment metagenome TaxID=412755 RepID=A0A0F9FXX1_9ZZZZ